jgi:hypothetical protein
VREQETSVRQERGGIRVDNEGLPLRVSNDQRRLRRNSESVTQAINVRLLTNIARTNFLRDLDVRTIYPNSQIFIALNNTTVRTNSAQQKATVQAELHVGGARSLCTCGRDVLTDVRSWNKDFC